MNVLNTVAKSIEDKGTDLWTNWVGLYNNLHLDQFSFRLLGAANSVIKLKPHL